MKYFAIFSRTDKNSQSINRRVTEQLIQNNWEVNEIEPELVIVIGGDGKVLRAIRKYLNNIENIKFVALNTGTLGFLTDYKQGETDKMIEAIINGKYEEEKCHLIEVDLHYANNTETLYGANEFRVEHRFWSLDIDVAINGEHLENIIGNGVCISTPFGSTAYNRSLGGAIIDRTLPLLQLTEIAGITHLKHESLINPLILGPDKQIELKCKAFSGAFIGVDNQLLKRKNIHKITVKMSERCITFAHLKDFSFTKKLQEKYISGEDA